MATSEEVTSVHAVKPSNRHRSLFYAVVIVSRDVISRFYAVISDVIAGSTRWSAVTSSRFYAVVIRDVIEFYAAVKRDGRQFYAG